MEFVRDSADKREKNTQTDRRQFLVTAISTATAFLIAGLMKPEEGGLKSPPDPLLKKDRETMEKYLLALNRLKAVFDGIDSLQLARVYKDEMRRIMTFAEKNTQSNPFVPFRQRILSKTSPDQGNYSVGNMEQYVKKPDGGLMPGAFYSSDKAVVLISGHFDPNNLIHQLTALHETMHAMDCSEMKTALDSSSGESNPIQMELRAYAMMLELLNARTGGLFRRLVTENDDLRLIIRPLIPIVQMPQEFNEFSKSLMGMLLTLIRLAKAYYKDYRTGGFSDSFIREVFEVQSVAGPVGYLSRTSGKVRALRPEDLGEAVLRKIRGFGLNH